MNIVVSAALLVGGLFWVWGALSGRLAGMLGALVQPKWLVSPPGGTTTGTNFLKPAAA